MQEAMSTDTSLERVPAVASYLGVSRSKVYAMMETGELPYVKLGKSRRVPRWAIQRLIEKHLVRRGE